MNTFETSGCAGADWVVGDAGDVFTRLSSASEGTWTGLHGEERLLVEAELALGRCDFARARNCCVSLSKFTRFFPCVVRIGSVAAIGLGDVLYFDELRAAVENFRREQEADPQGRFLADILEGWLQICLWRFDLPQWIRLFDMEALPMAWRQSAAYLGVMAHLRAGNFDVVYATVSLMMSVRPKLSSETAHMTPMHVNLMMAKAVACRETGKDAEMRRLLETAIRALAPRGILLPFILFLYGTRQSPVAEILRAVAPREVGRLRKIDRSYFVNLIRVRNHVTGERMADDLTLREFYLATLLKRGMLYKELASHIGMSLGRIKNIMQDIHLKLDVHSRSELEAKIW